MNKPIVVLAGWSAVGKSTVGPVLCEKYGFRYINHQELLHGLAEAQGYKRSRYWLASVGIEKFIDESVNDMVARIKNNQDNVRGFLIDATYGRQMLIRLRESFPDGKVIIISVLASPEIREERMMKRMGVERGAANNEMQFRDGFLSEAGLDEVLIRPDFEVHNTGELEETVLRISEFLTLKEIEPI